MSVVGANARRFALLNRRMCHDLCLIPLRDVWAWKQDQEPHTALPADFPYLSRLAAFWYTAVEDLVGADTCELTDLGFTSRQAAEILAALP